MSESLRNLIKVAEVVTTEDAYQYRKIVIDSQTALAVQGFLSVEKINAETSEDREVPPEEDFFVMLSDRLGKAI